MNRTDDIGRRFQLAHAEQSLYLPGSRYYEQLQEVKNFILREYTGNKYIKRTRHGFRMSASGYRLVILEDNELE